MTDPFRMATWNVNGLRAVVRKGFAGWLEATKPDVVCLQETRIPRELVPEDLFPGYRTVVHPAERSGHGGVATLVGVGLDARVVATGIGDADLDREGRVLVVDVGGLRVVNAYATHAHRKLLRRNAKRSSMAGLDRALAAWLADGPPLALLGDLNVANAEIDLANPRANRGNAGFLPEERAWIDGLLARGFVDAFRRFEPGDGHYTWWSQLPGLRDRNVGWRLDYALVDARAADRILACRHLAGQPGSDHCPVIVELSGASPAAPDAHGTGVTSRSPDTPGTETS